MMDQTQLLRQVRQALQTGDYQKAVEALKTAAEIAHREQDRGAEGRHLGNLALIYYRMGQPERALIFFQKALTFARAEQDQLTESGLLGNIGNIQRELGRYQEAKIHLEQALKIAEQNEDLRGRGIWLGNLGLVYDDLGESAQALPLHQSSVEIARHLQDQRGLAARLANLATCLTGLSHWQQAIEVCEESWAISETLGDVSEVLKRCEQAGNLYSQWASTVTNRSEAHQYFKAADARYQHGLTFSEKTQQPEQAARFWMLKGHALGNSQQFQQAISAYQAAYRLFDSLGIEGPLDDLRDSIALAKKLQGG